VRSVIAFTATSFLLSGCFLLGKMEDGMDKTNASVADSNRLIGETKDGQQLALAIELMKDVDTSTNLRVAASETVFRLSAEDRIGKYVGFPTLYKLKTIGAKVGSKTVDFPNVAVVGKGIDPTFGVAMINEELYEIQSFAALNLLRQLVFKSKMPGLTAEDNDYLRSVTTRLIPLACGILGGAKVEDIKAAYATGKAWPYAKSVEDRKEASFLIGELLRLLSLDTEENKAEARTNIEVRLGVGSY